MTRRLPRRALLAVPMASPIAARAQSRDLTIVSWGGAYQEAQREAFFRPFAARTGARILEETWDGGLDTLRARLSGTAAWDVVAVEGDELERACAEGLLEPLDPAALGGADRFVPDTLRPCGLGAATYAFVLAYDRAHLPAGVSGPTGWPDLLDTARLPGRRALRRTAKSTLEVALMADGLPPDAVYPALSTADGTDRAFRTLDALRPHLAWWERGGEPQRLLATGEAAMAVAYNGRVEAANRDAGRDLRLVWRGAIRATAFWAVARGSPDRDRALAFLRFVAEPEVAIGLPARIPYAVAPRAAMDALPDDLRATLPDAPDNARDGLAMNDAFWAREGDRLTARFTAWLAR